ncbi:hypothetical protein J8273_1976 [Carpediemonas membranifera]|uniref:Uncharacterized protein n=1 Tax=Carpediemonas membranifera TaxID=201153 RepID=A0A8J6E6C0_9EUKA|nr:hypothetical protein J8273_1976 [Carpediemonas membranifera]|eukprot:KAG9396922.1 hypothetical protein J8273_1976 [Carpediemonas membranifera]
MLRFQPVERVWPDLIGGNILGTLDSSNELSPITFVTASPDYFVVVGRGGRLVALFSNNPAGDDAPIHEDDLRDAFSASYDDDTMLEVEGVSISAFVSRKVVHVDIIHSTIILHLSDRTIVCIKKHHAWSRLGSASYPDGADSFIIADTSSGTMAVHTSESTVFVSTASFHTYPHLDTPVRAVALSPAHKARLIPTRLGVVLVESTPNGAVFIIKSPNHVQLLNVPADQVHSVLVTEQGPRVLTKDGVVSRIRSYDAARDQPLKAEADRLLATRLDSIAVLDPLSRIPTDQIPNQTPLIVGDLMLCLTASNSLWAVFHIDTGVPLGEIAGFGSEGKEPARSWASVDGANGGVSCSAGTFAAAPRYDAISNSMGSFLKTRVDDETISSILLYLIDSSVDPADIPKLAPIAKAAFALAIVDHYGEHALVESLYEHYVEATQTLCACPPHVIPAPAFAVARTVRAIETRARSALGDSCQVDPDLLPPIMRPGSEVPRSRARPVLRERLLGVAEAVRADTADLRERLTAVMADYPSARLAMDAVIACTPLHFPIVASALATPAAWAGTIGPVAAVDIACAVLRRADPGSLVQFISLYQSAGCSPEPESEFNFWVSGVPEGVEAVTADEHTNTMLALLRDDPCSVDDLPVAGRAAAASTMFQRSGNTAFLSALSFGQQVKALKRES